MGSLAGLQPVVLASRPPRRHEALILAPAHARDYGPAQKLFKAILDHERLPVAQGGSGAMSEREAAVASGLLLRQVAGFNPRLEALFAIAWLFAPLQSALRALGLDRSLPRFQTFFLRPTTAPTKIVGMVSLDFEAAETSSGPASAELTWYVHPNWRGQGLATEMAQHAMSWATDARHVREFSAVIRLKNRQSAAVAQRLGFHAGEVIQGRAGDETRPATRYKLSI